MVFSPSLEYTDKGIIVLTCLWSPFFTLAHEEAHTEKLEWVKELRLVLNTNNLPGATCSEELIGWIFPAAGCGNE